MAPNGYQPVKSNQLNGLNKNSDLMERYEDNDQPTVYKTTKSSDICYLIDAPSSELTLYYAYDKNGKSLGQYKYVSNQLSEYVEEPDEWSLKKSDNYTDGLDTLQSAELEKLNEWLGEVPERGPLNAAKYLGMNCTELKGSNKNGKVYHLYLGAERRLFFQMHTKTKTVYLDQIGHTK